MSNVYTGEQAEAWQDQEAERLQSMQALVGNVARQDLIPLFADLRAERRHAALDLIDLGAGPDMDVENLCVSQGVSYAAYDGNQSFLDARRAQAAAAGVETDPARLILGRLEDMSQIQDAAYDVSHSRAATAWSAKPDETIAEQLRITGRAAVFTEYDWTSAAVTSENTAVASAGSVAKNAMVATLEAAKFNTEFGADLHERVERVARVAGFVVELETERHELPEGDHRALFVDAAETLLTQLENAGSGNAVAAAKAKTVATLLRRCLGVIQDAPHGTVSVRLPALTTVIARISDKS